MSRRYRVAILEDRCPFDDVTKLSDIAAPTIVRKDPFNFGRKANESVSATLEIGAVNKNLKRKGK